MGKTRAAGTSFSHATRKAMFRFLRAAALACQFSTYFASTHDLYLKTNIAQNMKSVACWFFDYGDDVLVADRLIWLDFSVDLQIKTNCKRNQIDEKYMADCVV